MTDNRYIDIPDDPQWSGYTLDEIRYRRALILARIEIEKERIGMGAREIYSSKLTRMPGVRGSGIISRLLSALTMADYAVIGIKLIRKISAIYRSSKRN